MPVTVSVHESVFPEAVRRGFLEGLRARAVAPRFHYESDKQAQRWLAVHEAHSPARRDPDCARIYEQAFEAAAAALGETDAHVIALGCGGGQKEARLLRELTPAAAAIVYTPCDVSLPLVLESRRAALEVAPKAVCQPLLCDLTQAKDLPLILDDYGFSRLVTLFGVLPNVEPDALLPKVAELTRPGDLLLLSANLAPGADYVAGVKQVLPGYDNAETRLWLLTLLLDLGVEAQDGTLQFAIEETPAGVLRIVADFQFLRDRLIAVAGEQMAFRAGEKLRLFYSYRYTAGRMAKLLAAYGLEIIAQWITRSGEEAVFQCRKEASAK